MGSWPYIIGLALTIIIGFFTWYGGKERRKRKKQAAKKASLKKAKKTGKAQDVLSYFNRRNRSR